MWYYSWKVNCQFKFPSDRKQNWETFLLYLWNHFRQCMAACFFLLKQFDDVLLYLNSIKSYFYSEDTFNFNYGQAKAAVGNYQEAEEIFLNINDEKLKTDYAYLSWLARCFIMNSKVKNWSNKVKVSLQSWDVSI